LEESPAKKRGRRAGPGRGAEGDARKRGDQEANAPVSPASEHAVHGTDADGHQASAAAGVGGAAASSSKQKRAATKYNLFLKEKLEEIKERRPELDHRQRFAEAARLWHLHRHSQPPSSLPAVAAEESAADGAGLVGGACDVVRRVPAGTGAAAARARVYKCSMCGQPKKGHACPFKAQPIECESDDDDAVGAGAGECEAGGSGGGDDGGGDTESDSSEDSSTSDDADSDVGRMEEEEELMEEEASAQAGGASASAAGGSMHDPEGRDWETPEQKKRNEEILAKALADVETVRKGGGRFNFDVPDLFRKHTAEWSRHLQAHILKRALYNAFR